MPAPQLHLSFGQSVKDHLEVHPALRRACAAEPCYTRLGSIFHDLPYYGNMIVEAVRYGMSGAALDEPWAYRMHSVRPDAFVASYIRAAARTPGLLRDERLALVGGLISHAALDLTLHPLVNFCARRDTAIYGGHESVHHRATEKFHALFFHVDRRGQDLIGTREFARMTRIVKHGSAVRPRVEAPILDFMQSAYGGCYGDAPGRATFANWVRSFRHFGLLVGAPWAARNSQRLCQDRTLRARYYDNSVFQFDAFYACSERRLPQLANLAYDYFEANDFSAETEQAFLRAARIDDLAEPVPQEVDGLPALPRLGIRCTPGITAPPGYPPWRRKIRKPAGPAVTLQGTS